MDPRPIGVFDSGLGGLTAVRQLRRVLPGEDIVYFGDTGRVPYGSRARETIVQYARQDIRFLLSQNVKFIIAACGTVSSTFPSEEAARLPVPYTGVVGAASRAAVNGHAQRQDRHHRHSGDDPQRVLRRRHPRYAARASRSRPRPARCLCRWWKTATRKTAAARRS